MPLRRAGKKMRAPLLGLAKSIYELIQRSFMIQIDVGREVCISMLFAQNYSLRGLDFQNKSLRVTEDNIVIRNEFST